jgi:hypothetical protein
VVVDSLKLSEQGGQTRVVVCAEVNTLGALEAQWHYAVFEENGQDDLASVERERDLIAHVFGLGLGG